LSRKFPHSHSHRSPENHSLIGALVANIFYLVCFTGLPMLLTIILNWSVYTFTAHNFYQSLWMAPILLLISTFWAGALSRQMMEDKPGGMRLFVLAILAFSLFAWLTYYDIQNGGGLYSQFLPRFLTARSLSSVYMLPGIGILGMLFYKYFTLKL
jgi:hypothetical protein